MWSQHTNDQSNAGTWTLCLSRNQRIFNMAGFEQQVKERAKELKSFFKKGVKIVGDSCKKGWNRVKHIKG
ncbi:hypothetical protein RIF29_31433 [Crotalaria pallida]|uniref:Uncharacterized protein n=1 Tax=Crotalaria pallida TaxID=3830 RepID=A0AAN9EH81_CROPI